MAGRPKKPDTDFKVALRKTGPYRYAATHPYILDPNTGCMKRRYIYWGTVTEDMIFEPNDRFILASEEERKKLIFPDDWDMSKANNIFENKFHISEVNDPYISNDGSAFTGTVNTIPKEGQFYNRFYGGPWFLWGIAVNRNVIEDLLNVFDQDQRAVNDVMTLAMFPILTRWNYTQTARWQSYTKTPSNHELSSSYITRFTQKITDEHRMNFLKLRIERQKPKTVVACDSTTRSGYGKCLADIRWGKNKDNAALQNTLEVVVYSIDSHEPIYYRTFGGNENDGRTLRTVISDLKALGCKDLVIIFDRGYESDDNITEMIRKEQPFLVCGKVGQTPVYDALKKVTYTNLGIPQNLTRFGNGHMYAGQFKIDKTILLNLDDPSSGKTAQLKINVFVDIADRAREIADIHTVIQKEEQSVSVFQGTKVSIESLKKLKKQYQYYKLSMNREGILTAALNSDAVEKAERTAGFFSSVSYLIDGNAVDHFDLYALRDEQEKYFEEMKDQLGFNMQNNWSEDGKTGRLFILFIGLIMHTAIRNIWKTKMRDTYRSAVDLLHTMLPIRFVEYEDGTTHITGFTTPQVEICSAFSLPIPEDCLSSTQKKEIDRKTNPKKRGRPKGSVNKKK